MTKTSAAPKFFVVRRYHSSDRFDRDQTEALDLNAARHALKTLADAEFTSAKMPAGKVVTRKANRVEYRNNIGGGIAYYIMPAGSPEFDRDAAK